MAGIWDFLQNEQNQKALSLIGGSVASMVAGLWAVFILFRKKPDSAQGIPPDQVVAMLKILLLQAQGREFPPDVATHGNIVPALRDIDHQSVSRFLSLVLRHDPGAVGPLSMDREGWVNVDALISGVNASGYRLTMTDLELVVRTSLGNRGEPRFGFSPNKKQIRANWGRTVGAQKS